MTTPSPNAPPETPAQLALRRIGARITDARLAVLTHLLTAGTALSHQELLAASPMLDRVTLYRTLDWLVGQGLAHKLVGEDRVGRFHAATGGGIANAHFQCLRCGRTVCLDGILPTPELPAGFRAQRVDILVHGRCADCV